MHIVIFCFRLFLKILSWYGYLNSTSKEIPHWQSYEQQLYQQRTYQEQLYQWRPYQQQSYQEPFYQQQQGCGSGGSPGQAQQHRKRF